MAPLFWQTLIRTTASSARIISSAAKAGNVRRFSNLPKSSSSSSSYAELMEAEAMAMEKIEDAIHSYIVKKSRPDWLPFVPGASYWVPPRLTSYGVADFVNKLANALTDEESLSLTTLQGWPASAFYIHNGACNVDPEVREELHTKVSIREEEG